MILVIAALAALVVACAGPPDSGPNQGASGLQGVADKWFPVPGSTLRVSLGIPNLRKAKERGDFDVDYAFEGRGGRFIATFFVERAKGTATSHRDVYAHYWPLTSRNPLIDKATVDTAMVERYVKVQNFYRGKVGDAQVSVKNVN